MGRPPIGRKLNRDAASPVTLATPGRPRWGRTRVARQVVAWGGQNRGTTLWKPMTRKS